MLKIQTLIKAKSCWTSHTRTILSIPETMRAWEIYSYGGNSVLTLSTNRPVPELKSSQEVLVKIKAASINALDISMRGGYGSKMMNQVRGQQNLLDSDNEFPLILGRDCSGVVVKTARNVNKFKVGDPVWGVISPFRQGSHAEYVVASQNELNHKPSELNFVEAASFPYTVVTSWSALVTIGGLSPDKARGRKVLVHGAAGGIGSLVVQLLTAWGADVTGVCSTKSVSLIKELGVKNALGYDSGGLREELRRLGPFHLAIDAVGTDTSKALSLDCLKPWSDAKYISVVTPLLRNADEYGSALGVAKSLLDLGVSLGEGMAKGIGIRWAYFIPNGEVLSHVKKLISERKMQPLIDKVYSFECLREAYMKMEKGGHFGKLVVKMGDE